MNVIYDWANPEEAAKVIAQIRREALEDACKIVCGFCADGRPIQFKKYPNSVTRWMHESKLRMNEYYMECLASDIRKLMEVTVKTGE